MYAVVNRVNMYQRVIAVIALNLLPVKAAEQLNKLYVFSVYLQREWEEIMIRPVSPTMLYYTDLFHVVK